MTKQDNFSVIMIGNRCLLTYKLSNERQIYREIVNHVFLAMQKLQKVIN